MSKKKIIISACLLGERCRYDGKAKLCKEVEMLGELAELVLVCPEILGGLPTPRDPSERCGDGVYSSKGKDVTENFRAGAERVLEIARENGIKYALLKERSPSCGVNEIYDGSFSGKVIPGQGVTSELLAADGVSVFSEEQLAELLTNLQCN